MSFDKQKIFKKLFVLVIYVNSALHSYQLSCDITIKAIERKSIVCQKQNQKCIHACHMNQAIVAAILLPNQYRNDNIINQLFFII